MATGTFNQNSLRKNILEPLKKTSSKGLKNLNLEYVMFFCEIFYFILTTLFAHVTPNSSTQLAFCLTHEHVAHGNEPTCQFT